MVYITGDCHAVYHKFTTVNFPEQKDLTRDDFIIVCGDFGLWHKTKTEEWWLDWLSGKSFTLLFADGNHENFDRLYSDEFEVVDFHGGKAHRIRDNIYHLMRGHVFDFCGKKFFVFGGATSHDIADGILDRDDFKSDKEFDRTYYKWWKQGRMFRVNHESWWEQELPSQSEMGFGMETLQAHDNRVDYVISHCLPQNVASAIGFCGADPLTLYFDKLIDNGLTFKEWFAGHYHINRRGLDRYTVLYDDIIRII